LAAAGIAALAYAAACGYLWKEQRQLIFLPQAVVARTPTDVGMEFQEVRIPVGEQGSLYAWWLPADSHQAAAAVLLYLRGNDGNLGREVDRLWALHRHGFPILAIDYRGYGRSSGPRPSEEQVYEDASAAWDYLVRTQGVAPGRIVIYGHSLGGAVATELALRRGPACGVVLEGTFTSMSEMGRLEYPWIPVDWLLHERFDTLVKIGRLDLPMVFVHGTADREVPPAMTERLYHAAHRDKQLVMVKGAGHEQAMPMAGEPMVNAMANLARACGRR
jgi:pimeloyl-ACP methyl ester carboxylesterase